MLSSDGQYSLSIVMSYCSLADQIYAMSCNLTGRCRPPGSRHQYLRGLYRYDLSIHAVVPHALRQEPVATASRKLQGALKFMLPKRLYDFGTRTSHREQARSRRLKTRYTTQIGISVRIGIGCAPASRQPCREDNRATHTADLHALERKSSFQSSPT